MIWLQRLEDCVPEACLFRDIRAYAVGFAVPGMQHSDGHWASQRRWA
jgi:hypothetical protein